MRIVGSHALRTAPAQAVKRNGGGWSECLFLLECIDSTRVYKSTYKYCPPTPNKGGVMRKGKDGV